MLRSEPSATCSNWLTALLLFVCASASHAQYSNNILGLPAIPQNPQPAASGAPAPRPVPAPGLPTEAEIKSVLSGSIKLASFYQEGLATVRIATEKTYADAPARALALRAARLVQRDVRLSCGKLCKPAPMPAPKIQADNTLSFDIVISGYTGTLSTADMINLVSTKAIGPGTKPAPAQVAPAAAASAAAASGVAVPAASTPLGTPPAAAPPATSSPAAPPSAAPPPTTAAPASAPLPP